jgi:hypothetical protein
MVALREARMADDGELERERHALDVLLGDTRSRFHKRLTPFSSSEPLIALDREIRGALLAPPSPELQAEVRKLTLRLRALDPR